jgi:ParB-like chromosome segregation protein Spo0J
VAKKLVTHVRDLKGAPRNARKHTDRSINTIATGMKEVGAARSIVIDENSTILAGNGTIKAAKRAGITKVRVVEAAGDEIIAVRRVGLTDDQKHRLALIDNRASDQSEWDLDELRKLDAESEGRLLSGLFTGAAKMRPPML